MLRHEVPGRAGNAVLIGPPVRFRGHANGRVVDETVMVKSVIRAIDANKDWQGVIELFTSETDIVVSNVGEGGYDITAEDRLHRPAAGVVPKSYPAKLLSLLIHRFQNGAAPLLILPCELVSDNGEVLHQLLVGLSDGWNESPDFKAWLAGSVMICDTLVDRIVSEPIEPIGAVAEPYGLWAIKRQPGFEPPLQHPNITYTDDLEPFLRLKLHILNLGHTYLAHPLACAAALAVQETIQNDDLLANVVAQGEHLKRRLCERFANHHHVGDIRGRGLFRAVELVADRATKEPFDPALKLHSRIKAEAMERGLICYPGGGTIDGARGDHVLLAPPFIIERQHIDTIVDRLGGAIDAALASAAVR
mgnify:CR=1 FL=1